MKGASLTHRRKGSSELAAELSEGANKNISALTVRRMLLEVGLKGGKARKKPYLSQANKKKPLEIVKIMKIGHLMIGAKLFGLMKVTLR